MKRILANGEKVQVEPRPNRDVFPKSIVEPNQALGIREIYARWRANKPTSVHPFVSEFDDNADDIDFGDTENPVDRCQIENDIEDSRNRLEFEKQEGKLKRKEKKSKMKELADTIKSAMTPDPSAE